jgi:NAD(P)-dependent dehydrogenase (short-subunit alcohol dehydrogenase family)
MHIGVENDLKDHAERAADVSCAGDVNPSQFDLAGRVAVVLGGTSGIGRTLAFDLASAGADVVATGRRETLVAEVAADIEARGRRTVRQPCDVTDEAALLVLRERCLRDLGRVDILICAYRHKRNVVGVRAKEGNSVTAASRRVPIIAGFDRTATKLGFQDR